MSKCALPFKICKLRNYKIKLNHKVNLVVHILKIGKIIRSIVLICNSEQVCF